MMKMNKRPSFIKDEELSPVIDNDNVPKKGRIPEYATYGEWNKLGYQVMKGEKSYCKQEGVIVFHRDQVKKKVSRDYDDYDGWDEYYDGYDEDFFDPLYY